MRAPPPHKLVRLDRRHKGRAYFKYRLEFRDQYRQDQTAVERFAAMQIWFTQQYGIGYHYNIWTQLAQEKSSLLNPYWCFDHQDQSHHIYMWDDQMLTMFNLVHGGKLS